MTTAAAQRARLQSPLTHSRTVSGRGTQRVYPWGRRCMDVQRDEFERWMNLIRDDIQEIHARLDELNGRTRTNETHIAVLTDRGTHEDREARRSGMRGGAIIAAIAAAVEIARHFLFTK